MEIPNLPVDILRHRIRRAVLSRAARVPGIIVGYIDDVVTAEVRQLKADVDATLDRIASLPEQMKKAAAYEFFASFFSHYLPKKFLQRYIYGNGSPPPLMLTEKEMIDCNPYITLLNCRKFNDELGALAPTTGKQTKPLSLRCPAAALTNGTLGQFTVKINATLTYEGPDNWTAKGRMSFYDEWDFDPKEFGSGGRSLQGELKTRFAHHVLPGKGFVIESAEVDFQQASSDAMIVWKGGTPSMQPDRIAALDVELRKE